MYLLVMRKVIHRDWLPSLNSITSILVNFTMHNHKPRQESWRIGNARTGIARPVHAG